MQEAIGDIKIGAVNLISNSSSYRLVGEDTDTYWAAANELLPNTFYTFFVCELWHNNTIYKILRNEKYQGDLLLQKQFRVDHLTKTDRKNRGELPQYLVKDNHEAIIPREQFDEVQDSLRRRGTHLPGASGTHKTYPFSSKLKCSVCGKNYRRRVNTGKIAWQCSTFLDRGKDYCPSPQIRESVFEQISADVLGLDQFDGTVFTEQIEHVLVDHNHKLIFRFYDGQTAERRWENPSRSESWTPEMRAMAAEYNKRKVKK